MEGRDPRLGNRLAVRVVAAAVIAIVLGAVIFGVYLPRVSTTSAKASSSASITLTSVSSSTSPTSSSSAGEYSSTSATSLASAAESSLTISPAPCALPYRVLANATFAYGTQGTENAASALVMRAGSTMELCIEYVDPAYTNQSVSTATDLYAFSWPDSPGLVGVQPADNVSATATPENLSLSPGQSTVVEYKLSAGENSTGFDGLTVGPVGDLDCAAIPIPRSATCPLR